LIPVALSAPAQCIAWSKRRGDAEHAVDVFLVIDGVAPPSGDGEIGEQRLHVGDRLAGAWRQPAFGPDPGHLGRVKAGQDGLACRAGVRQLADAERRVQADCPRAVDPVDEHRVTVVDHGDPNRQPGRLVQVLEDRCGQPTERQSLAGDVAKPHE
jgi:hypothetical protein